LLRTPTKKSTLVSIARLRRINKSGTETNEGEREAERKQINIVRPAGLKK
jgi:hypothetical protein